MKGEYLDIVPFDCTLRQAFLAYIYLGKGGACTLQGVSEPPSSEALERALEAVSAPGGCCKRMPQKPQTLPAPRSGGWKSKVKAPADPVSGETCFLVHRHTSLLEVS